jgi:uncharacterized protein (TIGR02757 family)
MPADLERYRAVLDEHYAAYNRRQFVHPDPLEFVLAFDDPAEQEIVALIAGSLAYGRVEQIRRSVFAVLRRMESGPPAAAGPPGRADVPQGAEMEQSLRPISPARFLRDRTPARIAAAMAGFKHRFTTDDELTAMLVGARGAIRRHGSLERCFLAGLSKSDETVMPALGKFVACLDGPGEAGSMLSNPSRGSACKRLNLMLRWMVRRDQVDPGPWRDVPRRLLVVPLDTHMLHIARFLGLTRRTAGDMRTALEITAAFGTIRPDDPVRYDFCLTRLGLNRDVHPCEFLTRL